eukprot:TRINITY_DN22037_c0_g1_i1.p1 TRINITY_DN22037_c0_g1~~TRINITY_DN22037_c0_g1_i1.p1  ORF type:complete len:232 (-),score=9.73 TRINITY_DN22037_c0_g1_i1:157-825(-)
MPLVPLKDLAGHWVENNEWDHTVYKPQFFHDAAGTQGQVKVEKVKCIAHTQYDSNKALLQACRNNGDKFTCSAVPIQRGEAFQLQDINGKLQGTLKFKGHAWNLTLVIEWSDKTSWLKTADRPVPAAPRPTHTAPPSAHQCKTCGHKLCGGHHWGNLDVPTGFNFACVVRRCYCGICEGKSEVGTVVDAKCCTCYFKEEAGGPRFCDAAHSCPMQDPHYTRK